MTRANRRPEIVCLKQSGEEMGGYEAPFTVEKISETAERLKRVAEELRDLGIAGLLLVSGGGNLLRGRSMQGAGPHLAARVDPVARWGTCMNTIVLGGALEDAGVENQILMAPGMQLKDPSLRFPSFNLNKANLVFKRGQVVLMAGGIGENGGTTDWAVTRYGAAFAQFGKYGRVGLYKATPGVDGMYSKDPAKYPDARFIPEMSAGNALASRIQVVDERSLEVLRDYKPKAGAPDIGLRIYNSKVSLVEVILSERNGDPIGSMIRSGY